MTPPRAGLDREAVLDAAVRVVDGAGAGALSLKAIADSVGVRPPSLYNHVEGLEDVRGGLRLRAYELVAAAQTAAVGDLPQREWVGALLRSHRRFALEHPGLYAAIQPSAHGPDTDPAIRRAAERVLAQLVEAVEALGPTADEAVHAVRALRSAVLGFIGLESAGHFGMAQDVDESFERLVGILERGIAGGAGRRQTSGDAGRQAALSARRRGARGASGSQAAQGAGIQAGAGHGESGGGRGS